MTEIVERFGDVRRFIAGRTSTYFRTFLILEAIIEDIEGGLEEARSNPGYLECLPDAGRAAMYLTFSVMSARTSGAIGSMQSIGSSYQEVFAGVDDDVIEEGLRLAEPPADQGLDAYEQWFTDIRAFMARHIDLPGETLPEIRSPDGMFTAMAMARDWMMLGAQMSVSPAPFMS